MESGKSAWRKSDWRCGHVFRSDVSVVGCVECCLCEVGKTLQVQQALWHPVKLDTSSGLPPHRQEDDGHVPSVGQLEVLTFDSWLPLSMSLGPLPQLSCHADGLKELLVQFSHNIQVCGVREANQLHRKLQLLFNHRGEEGRHAFFPARLHQRERESS